MWLTLRDGTEVRPGDEIKVTVGGEEYQGHLNEIGPGYITVANTGFTPIADYAGSSLGFPTADITKIEKL